MCRDGRHILAISDEVLKTTTDGVDGESTEVKLLAASAL